MTTLRPFTCDDLFTYNDVNTDVFTETFNLNFYLGYLATWPEYFSTAEAPAGQTAGYVMGKVEGRGENWHGHVTAVTVVWVTNHPFLPRTRSPHLTSLVCFHAAISTEGGGGGVTELHGVHAHARARVVVVCTA